MLQSSKQTWVANTRQLAFWPSCKAPWCYKSQKEQIMQQVKWLASILRRTRRSTCQSIPRSRGLLAIPVVARPPLHWVIILPSFTTLPACVEVPRPCNVIQGNGRSCLNEGQNCLGCSWHRLSRRNKNVPDSLHVIPVRITGQPCLITRRLMEQIELHYRQTVYPKTHKCKQKRNTCIKIFQHETQACIPSDSIQNHSNISLQASFLCLLCYNF